jgi:hypothetical protein
MANEQNNAILGLPSDEEILRSREAPRTSQAVGLPSDEAIRSYRRPTTRVQEPVYDPMGVPTGAVEREYDVQAPRPYENLPTVSEMPLEGASLWQRAKVLAGLPFARTSEGRENIIRENVPAARFTTDQYGNRLVVLPPAQQRGWGSNIFTEPEQERRYHIQRPDTFNADLLSAAVTSSLPALATIGYAPASIPAAALMQTGLAGGTSLLGSFLSNYAGAKEPLDYGHLATEMGVAAALPLGLGAAGRTVQAVDRFARGPAPSGYRNLDPGTRRMLETQPYKEQDVLDRQFVPGEIIADQPEMLAQFKRQVELNPSIARQVEPVIEARIQGRPARVQQEIDDAIGPLQGTQRDIIQHLADEKLNNSVELFNVLERANAGVNVQSAIDYIDRVLQSGRVPRTTSEETFLRRAREMLREETSPSGIPGRPISNPHAVQNVLNELDKSIKYGSTNASFQHGPIPGGATAARDLRSELSNIMKDQVPGYENVMGKYVDFYSAREAAQRADKLFAGGQNPLTAQEAEFFLNNPATRDYFVAGARAAFQRKISEKAAPLGQLAAIEGPRVNEVMALVFGPAEIERLGRFAAREATLQETENTLRQAVAAASERVGAARHLRTENVPAVSRQALAQFFGEKLQAPLARARGVSAELPGPAESYSRFFLSGGKEAENYLRGLQEARRQRQEIQDFLSRTSPVTAGAAGASGSIVAPPFKAGGRVGRASGGRLMRNDHSARAAALIKAAEAAKKAHNATTEGILEQPDEAVAKALSIANKAI